MGRRSIRLFNHQHFRRLRRETLYHAGRLPPIGLCLTPRSPHLPSRHRHRLVQGQNRQSGTTHHRLSRHAQFQSALMAEFVPDFLPDALHILALDRTQWMLAKDTDQLPRLVRRIRRHHFPLFWKSLAKRAMQYPRVHRVARPIP